MSFLTYAQNCEDVLLWRALGHVQNGFYIDVGANDPVAHSVTKAFYDAGWSGLNIEPLPSYHGAFMAQRPRDVNLALAAGAADGSITLFDVPAVHGWASSDRAVADAHRADGYQVAELLVPVRTLAGLCQEHVRGEIHFLKIDVEGFEGDVLRGMDFARWRPWVVVIEATLPNSRVCNHQSWEALVTTCGYRFAWFDGLNRYYVADEHPELMAALSVQPNVFDDFISYHLDLAWKASEAAGRAHASEAARANDATAASQRARDNVARLLAQVASMQQQFEQQYEQQGAALRETQEWARGLEHRLLATLASTSWRISAPVRHAGALVMRVKASAIGTRVRHLLRTVVSRAQTSEGVRRIVIPLMRRFPTQVATLRKLARTLLRRKAPAPLDDLDIAPDLRPMPERARRVLADLQRALSHHPKV